MKEHDIDGGMRLLAGEIAEKRLCAPRSPLMVGITGPVASGKTRTAHRLMQLLRGKCNSPIVYVPFDYWINTEKLDAATYSGRFHLDDYHQALQSMAAGERWMYPRYDLTKRGLDTGSKTLPEYDSPDLIWQQRRFLKFNGAIDRPNVDGVETLYVEAPAGRLFSLFPALPDAIYLIDGTLIFTPQNIRPLFDVKIFCFSNWPNRIARMIRRYRRGEVFGQASTTMDRYVRFLVHEAKNCADDEIAAQGGDDTFVIRSSVETVSNLLDLYYLKQVLLRGELRLIDVGALSMDEVDQAIEEATAHVKTGADDRPAHIVEELWHLQESSHLLAVENAAGILSELSKAISQTPVSMRQPRKLTVM